MYHSLLSDATLFSFLTRIDLDLAAEARAGGCTTCGGILHCAAYPRKPRGGPRNLGAEYDRRPSFCCAEEGCRRRTTPPSVRFLGRRVYLGVVVLLVAAMTQGAQPSRIAEIRAAIGVGRRTLDRWMAWWRSTFPPTPFWRARTGHFREPVDASSLPASLLQGFAGADQERTIAALRFLSPITTTSGRTS